MSPYYIYITIKIIFSLIFKTIYFIELANLELENNLSLDSMDQWLSIDS